MRRENIQRFSLRKLSVGLLSVTVGSVFLSFSDQEVAATELDQEEAAIRYHYVTEDELTPQEKEQIIQALPSLHAEQVSDYYLVYRPESVQEGSQNLPQTGTALLNPALALGSVALFIVGLKFTKKKTAKVTVALFLTGAGGFVLSSDALALSNVVLAQYNQIVNVGADGRLPAPMDIPDYRYIGYLKMDKAGGLLLPEGSESTDRLGLLQGLPNPSQEESSLLYPVPPVVAPQVPEETPAPGQVVPEPPVVTPEPPVVTPEPPVVTPEPPEVVPEPPVVTPEPGEVVPEPPVVTPEPPVVTPEPPVVTPEPPVVTPEPGEVVPEPPVVTPEPPVVTPEPGEVVPEPPVVTPEPPVVTPEPPVVTPEPPVVTPEPPVVTPEPGEVVPEPPVVTPEPPVVTPEPGEVIPEPPVVIPEPPVVTPEPPVVTPEPGEVVPEPPVVTPEPPVVTPEPGEAVPEPPVVTPEPPVVTPEPEEDVLEVRYEDLLFETVYEADEGLAYGYQKILEEGIQGTKKIVWNVTKQELVSEQVVLPPTKRLVRVGTQPHINREELPFKEVRQDDPNLEKGQEQVVTEGRAGLETSTTRYSVDAQTGQVTALPVEVETRPAEDRVIAVGTKEIEPPVVTPEPEDVLETRQEPIAFETVYESDESLAYGSSQVAQEGVAGTKEVVWNVTKDSLVSESVTSPAVSQIVRVGTQPSVTTKELPFKEVRQEDPSLEKGQEQVVTEGRAGLETSTTRYSVDAQTGQVTALPVEVETRLAEDRVIAVGTKEIEPPVVTPEPEEVLETRQEPIAFETVYESDESLAYGSSQVAQEGVAGTKEVVWNVTKDSLVSESVTSPAVSQIVRVGTQPSITTKELPFKEVHQEDPSLEKGQEQVVTEGRAGLETSTIRYSVDAQTGQVTALPVEVETRPAEDRVIAVGTKEIEPPVVTPEPEDVLEIRQEPIAFETVYESDESLAYGSSQVAQEGVAGTKEVVWNVTKDSLVSESVTSPAVSQIVRVGTQPSVTTKELPFKEVRQDDPNLEKGQEQVVMEGRAGLETSTIRYSVDTQTGQVTALPVEVETRPAEDRVIAVGTKEIEPPVVTPEPEDVLETRQEPIAFETVYESDESLAYGSSQVAQEGVAGTKEVVWNVTKDSLVSESVTSPAVSQIVRVGTQPSVTTKELPFKEIRQDDPNLEKGQEQVVMEGRTGLETSTTRYSVDAQTGQVTALPVEVETRPAEDRVIAVGTKEIEPPVVTPEPEDVLETRQEPIAFETVYESDESLAYGSSQVAQEGVAGTKELVWNVTKDSLVSESMTSPAVSQIVRVGTQPSVTTKELPFKEVRQDDPSLEKGQEKVVTEGRTGLETSTTRYSVDAQTGQVTALPVEVETRPAEDRVIAVGTKEDVLETRQEPIAFETVYESDESLAYGSSQVAQEGVAGTKEVVWNVTKDSLVSESVTSPAVSQIVRVGTQPSVTTKELPFKEVRQDDPTLEKGQERVVTEGRAGLETSTTRYSVDAQTGQVTALPVEVETRPAEDRVIAVGTKEDVLETRQEPIAFETVYESDESLAYGSSQVSQEGVAGTKEVVWNVTKDSLVSESVTSPAVSQIVRVGTQPSVTTKELPFKEIRQDDSSLEKGQERVVTEGRAGLETSTTRYSVDVKTGQVTALPVEVETRPAEDRVIAVGTKEDVLETRQEPIAFETVYESDESLVYGSSQVAQEGVEGTKEVVWNVTKNSLVSESVTSPAVPRIVRVGTQPSVTTKELPFKEVRQDDSTLEKGQEKVVTEGRAGLETSTTRYSVDAKTGQVTALPVEVETRPAENRVIAVGTKEDVLETRQEPIAFETVYESDESLAYGSSQVSQEGVAGTKELVWNVTKDRLVSERIARSAVSRIVRVGTQPSVTTKELPFKEVRQDDSTLEKGQERVVTEGRAGLETSTTRYSVDAKTGQVTALPTQIQVTPAIDHVIAVGTKEPVKPSLMVQKLEKDIDQKRVIVTYQLVDPDARYQSAKAFLYKEDELVRELVLSDPKQPVILSDLDYFTDYTLRTEMTYSLSGQAVTESQAKQEDFVLEHKKIELKDIQGIELHEKVGGSFRKVENLITPKSADTYFVNVRSKDSKDMLLPVSAIDEVEKDGKAVYRYTVSFPELVQEGQDGYKNDLALYIPKDGSDPSVANAYRANYLTMPEAKADREIAYYNTEKLLPFYTKDYLVYLGNQIDPNDKLYQTKLVDVVPMVDNRIVVDPSSDKTAINRLMLHYEDKTVAYIPVTYKGDFKNNQLAEYQLTGTPLLYTPENFLTSYQSVIDEVTPILSAIAFDSAEVRQALGIPEGDTSKNLGDLYLEKGFNDLKANLSQELRKLLAADKAINSGDGIIREKLVSDIKENAVPLLLGLSYLNRWYDINYGEINVKDLSVYKSDFFGKQDVSVLNQVIQLGKSGFDKLKAANNVTTFASHLASAKQKRNLFEYLESYRELFLPNKNNNEWLKENTKAYLFEGFSGIPEHRKRQEATYGQKNNKYSIGIYDRMASQSNVWKYQHMILPLLTMKEESVYIISNMSNLVFGGYERYRTGDLANLTGEDYNKAIRALVDRAGVWYRDYFDFWYKMLTEKTREKMLGPVVGYDGFLYYSSDGSRSWRNLYDKDASIQEFFGPAGRYYLNSGAGAFANGVSVYFTYYRFLDQTGAGILTHEMTHNFDDHGYLEGHRRREGMGGEHYAQGLLESPSAQNKAILGINMLFQFDENATDRYHAANPAERYKTPEDLQEYMKGVFDVLYLLEYVEGQAVLAQDTEVKKKWWRKFENEWVVDRDGNQTHAANKIRRLTDEEANQLKTFTDLIDGDILNRRYYRDEETLRRGNYYGLALLSPIYSAISNDKGAPGDLTFRRTAFELIAAKGYQEGFVPYASNMYAQEALAQGLKTWSEGRRAYVGLPNDQLIFEKIFKGEYASWGDFKKAMYQERIEKAQTRGLKPITIQYELGKPNSTQTVTISSLEDLQRLMNEAVQKDMTNIDRTTSYAPASWVNTLLSKVYNAYLRQSKDFRESIFK